MYEQIVKAMMPNFTVLGITKEDDIEIFWFNDPTGTTRTITKDREGYHLTLNTEDEQERMFNFLNKGEKVI